MFEVNSLINMLIAYKLILHPFMAIPEIPCLLTSTGTSLKVLFGGVCMCFFEIQGNVFHLLLGLRDSPLAFPLSYHSY
jgi:hypothetical protein